MKKTFYQNMQKSICAFFAITFLSTSFVGVPPAEEPNEMLARLPGAPPP